MSWYCIIGIALLKRARIILLSNLIRNFPFPHTVMKNTLHVSYDIVHVQYM